MTILLPGIYFSCEQVAALMKLFPRECYFRIQVLQTVFSSIVDLENLDIIYDKIFDDDERREVTVFVIELYILVSHLVY